MSVGAQFVGLGDYQPLLMPQCFSSAGGEIHSLTLGMTHKGLVVFQD